MAAKTKSKKTNIRSGSGGLSTIKSFNWKRNTPIVAVVAIVGGYLLYHSFAGTLLYANQYSMTACNATAKAAPKGVVSVSETTKSKPNSSKTYQACKDQSAEAFVYRAYKGITGNHPDKAGYQYWTQQLAGNRTKPEVLTTALLSSSHGTNLTAMSSSKSGSNTDFVKSVYSSVMGRKADAGGLNYWTRMLNDKKISRKDLVTTMAGYQEARNYFVNNAYKSVLGRKADTGGLRYWAAQPSSTDATRRGIIAALSNTNEGRNATVQSLYKSFLGRKADAGGLRYYTSQLASKKMSLPAIIVNLANSAEAVSHNRSEFLAYSSKTPSPKINPVAKRTQDDRVAQMKAYYNNANWRYKDFVVKSQQSAQRELASAGNVNSLSGDKITQAVIDGINRNITNVTNLRKGIEDQYAKDMVNDYNKILAIEQASKDLNAYSPDISIANHALLYKTATKNLLTSKDNAYRAIISYGNSINTILASANQKRSQHEANVRKLQAAQAAQARTAKVTPPGRTTPVTLTAGPCDGINHSDWTAVYRCQLALGVTADGNWGTQTQRAYDSFALKARIAHGEATLGSNFLGGSTIKLERLPVRPCSGMDADGRCSKDIVYNKQGNVTQYNECTMSYNGMWHSLTSCIKLDGLWAPR